MATQYPLPDAQKVQQILGMLFDGLDIKTGGTFDQAPTGGAWFGVFVGDGGAPVALCGVDVNLAASFGAALSMLPPAMAKEAAKTKQLTDVMCENLREIMNICTRLVLDAASPHLKLEKIYPRQLLPAAAVAILGGAQGHREFQLQLPKYGGGVLSLLST